jgi:nucleotide-binding universal stress UspA family protein/nitrite reductase/ring-hydroxylating ferredoxin subunit
VTYKRILFGTDGSAPATGAGAVATALAKAGRAELIVAHLFDRPGTPERTLASAVQAVEASGVKKVSGELRAGSAADGLIALAEERDVGVVVVGGRLGKGFGLGPVVSRIARRSPRDVLIVEGTASLEGGPLYRRLLIATDGSVTADRAARRGFALAEALGAAVTLVFVGHPSTGELVTKDTMATFAGEVETDVELREGDPTDQILRAADDVHADLIVIGNKGMKGAKGFLLGSVPASVCDASTRDVLIVRTVTQTVTELGRGEGGIVERGGEKLAAYMDPTGVLHVMSARCTHMGCTVAWNPGPRTFDCPCHGSRFGPAGEVVHGPAARPLPPA